MIFPISFPSRGMLGKLVFAAIARCSSLSIRRCRSNHASSGGYRSIGSTLGMILASGLLFPLGAQEFRITNIYLDAEGRPVIQYPADPNHYYILYSGDGLTNVVSAKALELGYRADLLKDASQPSASAAYYRVREVPINNPLDTDGDGIDDVYELEHADFQDPLNPADAAEFFEPGRTKLEEYLHRDDPDRPPVKSTADMVIGCGDTRYEGRDLVVDGITLTIDCQHTFRTLTVTNGGIVVTSLTSTQPLRLTISGDATVTTNSVISVNGRGHGPDEGPGKGGIYEAHGSGGGHGGRGGQGNWANAVFFDGGPTYGSWEEPVDFGSGGGQPGGSRGGGALRLEVGGTLLVAGIVSADGSNVRAHKGAGSGGSVWLEAGVLAGGGLISANGGNHQQLIQIGGGGGGGGRIAIYTPCPPNTSLLTISADGGTGFDAGEAGTIYFGVTSSGLHGVVMSSGPALQISAPASVDFQGLTNATAMVVFSERTNVTLPESLLVNLTAPGSYTTQADLSSGLTSLPAGIPVNSHYVHFDTGNTDQAESEVMLEVTLTFDSDILGVIVLTDQLVASDETLGNTATVYPGTELNTLRGLEIGDGVGQDGVILHEDRRSVTIIANVRDWADQVRIITDAYGECP